MSEHLQTTSETDSSKTNPKVATKSKMKCSICKQDGHNKRSCENNTASKDEPVKDEPVKDEPVKDASKDEPVKDAPKDAPVVKVKKSKLKPITKEEAEKSADEWVAYMRTWLVNAIMDPIQHRDIGKGLASVAEIHVNKWLSEKTGRPVKNVVGESYDGKTDDDKHCVRNQIKFRKDEWHFETTRRNSKKNAGTNSTGHVAYKNDEFDMLAIFKPSPTFGITGSTIRCIPVSVLVNPTKPDQLITNINANIRKVYDCAEKTEEVMRLLYQTPS
jgi:hypothetical protein